MAFFVTVLVTLLYLLAITAVFVQRKEKLGFLHFIFFTFIGCFIAWVILNYFSIIVLEPTKFITILRYEMTAVVLQGIAFDLFATNQPYKEYIVSRKKLLFLLIITILLMLVTWSNVLFDGTQIINQNLLPKPGIFPFFFPLLLVILYVDTAIVLVKKSMDPVTFRQGNLLGLAHLIFFILGFGLAFIPAVLFNSRLFIPYAPLFSVPLALAALYCLVRLRLVDKSFLIDSTKINKFFSKRLSKSWGDLSRRKKWDIGYFLFPPHQRFLKLLLKDVNNFLRTDGKIEKIDGLRLKYSPESVETYLTRGSGTLRTFENPELSRKSITLSIFKKDDTIINFDGELSEPEWIALETQLIEYLPGKLLILLGKQVI